MTTTTWITWGRAVAYTLPMQALAFVLLVAYLASQPAATLVIR